MTPLSTLARSGLSCRVEGGKLLVSPTERITPALRDLIRENRQAIVEELSRPLALATGLEFPDPSSLVEARECQEAFRSWAAHNERVRALSPGGSAEGRATSGKPTAPPKPKETALPFG